MRPFSSRKKQVRESILCPFVLTISKTNLKTPLEPLDQNPIFSSQEDHFQLLLEPFSRIQPEYNTPRQDLKSRRRDTAEEEAGQNKVCAGRRQSRRRKRKDKGDREEREGRVLTDLGRCNFREDPLRRWAQLVGALTRPLSRLAFRLAVLSLVHLLSRPSLVSRFYLRI